MTRHAWMLVFVVFPLNYNLSQAADEKQPTHTQTQYIVDGGSGFMTMPGAWMGGSAPAMHPQFDMPSHYYGPWHRPRAFGSFKSLRCEEEPFRVRGYGNLFHQPCASHRMDYSPHRLNTSRSQYGPAYHLQQEDQRCDDDRDCNCHFTGGSCRNCK